ncbi:MAG TPA: serine hydrolase domain-containing protein [Candidatus Eisenbacteria bacterium]|nr:serine hydrolase domain-containing protein [Candidatus Eisenbacteria bacterium]
MRIAAALALASALALGPAPASLRAEPAPSASVPNPVLARGAAFVAAVNDTSADSRKRAALDLFSESTRHVVPEEKIVALFQRLHDEYAPLEYHHSEAPGRSLHVFARKHGTRLWRDFQFRYDTEPPHRLTQLVFIAEVAEPVYLPNSALASPEALAWLNGYVDKLVREDDLSGALLVARGDSVLFQRYFGHEDAGRSRPVRAETRFNLGSGNKMFTALVVMRLVEEGKLRLDQPISEFFPDFPDTHVTKAITIRQLLAHSSGLGDYLTEAFERDGRRATRLEEFVPFAYAEFRANGSYFAPGSEHRYSNTGFLLLGRIIETITGKDYYDVVRETIYAPLGMSRTDHYLADGSVPDLARPLTRAPADSGATPGEGSWVEAPHGLRGTSAGGGFSTCADILRFARALVAGRVVSPAALAAMTTPQPPLEGAMSAYGLGFLLESSLGGRLSFGHGGTAPGVNFEFRYFPDDDVTLIVFGNQDNGAYDDLRKNVTKLVTGDR